MGILLISDGFRYIYYMKKVLQGKLEALNSICKRHHVQSLHIFGSATRDELNSNSDIDLLVKFEDFDLSDYFDNYIQLKSELKDLFGREVDLVEEQSLRNPILIQSINKNKSLVYG
ncbi:nucleotidyltransferase family protein [Reichenbachiella ulvae]|uniref:Nucleotidyltransferase domain-containing protein n=1 Tax=Reichenbachiella ulvae TaxID=2980104 RepID=A0ABT3CX06_9BACT|nr:nucleotidyltransferase domain-containing protein [Reichenbachiella ulvae]MCV9388226.1 nucleotidyltransferase domain-containing protein [Reichenbachiella ulvae]